MSTSLQFKHRSTATAKILPGYQAFIQECQATIHIYSVWELCIPIDHKRFYDKGFWFTCENAYNFKGEYQYEANFATYFWTFVESEHSLKCIQASKVLISNYNILSRAKVNWLFTLPKLNIYWKKISNIHEWNCRRFIFAVLSMFQTFPSWCIVASSRGQFLKF